MAILTGTLIYGMPLLKENVKSPSMKRIKKWVPALLLAVIAVAQTGQVRYYPEYVRALRENDRVSVIDYIQGNTEENDKVLIIGAESLNSEYRTEYFFLCNTMRLRNIGEQGWTHEITFLGYRA